MIQFVNVSKFYPREIVALENINFEIQEGEFVFLIGPSGSGKTTIIKMLTREEDPTQGKIYFDDEDITTYSRGKIYKHRRRIGVIFQDYKLIEDKTAYENVAFVMEAAGQGQKDIEETVPYVLDIVGLADRMNAFPKELSGGEKQRVAIARALSNNPKLLIADEPTGNLDPESAWDIVQILRKINDWGTTVFMSTHGINIVDELAKRVIKVENGALVSDEVVGKYQSQAQKDKSEFEKSMTETAAIDKERLTQSKKEKIEIHLTSSPTEIQNTEPALEIIESMPDAESSIEISETEENVPLADSLVNEVSPELPEVNIAETITEKPKPKLKISLVSKNKLKDKKAEKKENKESAKSEQKVEKIKEQKGNIDKLKLSEKVTAILADNGFKNVEDLINAGFDEVANIKELDTKELDKIKTSIAKFIQENL